MTLSPIAAFALLVGALALVAIAFALHERPSKPSRLGLALAASPAGLMIVLFYSLALHMHQSLGGWPTSIGQHGFPPLLAVHSSIATTWFTILMLLSFCAWPLAFLLCLIIPRWRSGVYYLGMYALAALVGLVAMFLAPAPFLNWWWD
ncbi:hypothetical protein [Limisphaera sp. VF-2]|jgi:hypothetical protein|uniref:hypothetical protein n=1 Tax=Limisphaera sp. VF-2 TaxID=3400418 RepID=UPI001761178B